MVFSRMQVSIDGIMSMYVSGLFPVSTWKAYAHDPHMKMFRKNDLIFREGEQAAAVFLLCKGTIVTVKKKYDNFYSVIDTLEACEILGLAPVISGVEHTTSAIAKGKVYAFKVSKQELLQFLIDHPSFYLSMAEKLSKKVLCYENKLST